MEVLKINGHDYSAFIERKGYGWSREDIDSEKTTRTKAGTLRRDKVCTKRKLSYKATNMTGVQLAQLDSDLSQDTFEATYLDLHGIKTKTFYCSSFSATLSEITDDESGGAWCEAAFKLIEV